MDSCGYATSVDAITIFAMIQKTMKILKAQAKRETGNQKKNIKIQVMALALP